MVPPQAQATTPSSITPSWSRTDDDTAPMAGVTWVPLTVKSDM